MCSLIQFIQPEIDKKLKIQPEKINIQQHKMVKSDKSFFVFKIYEKILRFFLKKV